MSWRFGVSTWRWCGGLLVDGRPVNTGRCSKRNDKVNGLRRHETPSGCPAPYYIIVVLQRSPRR